MQLRQPLTPLERFRLLHLRDLAPEEFISFFLEMGELMVLRHRQQKASPKPCPMNDRNQER